MSFIWTEDEIAFLEELANDWPFKLLVEKFQEKSKEEGWHHRTKNAIRIKLKRGLNLSSRATEKNFTLSQLAKILKMTRDRVWMWVRKGKLKRKKVGAFSMVTPWHLDQFRKDYPQLLSDADLDGLVFLFGKSRAEEIKTYPSQSERAKPKPVVHIPTGRIFPSLHQAAKSTYYDRWTVRTRIGKDFRFATKQEKEQLSEHAS